MNVYEMGNLAMQCIEEGGEGEGEGWTWEDGEDSLGTFYLRPNR